MDAILRLDEQNLKFCVESGEKLPDDAINGVIAAFGPLTEDILWEEKGSGDAEADERLLRETDVKKSKMVAFLIDKGFKFTAEDLLLCYTLRCVEVARVLLEAGVNPNGNTGCTDSILWMLRDGMRMYSHSEGVWKILTEVKNLLQEYGAVEYCYDSVCIYYEDWQLQCCGEPFKVGDTVTWQGCHTGKRDAQTDTYVDFTENHHVMNEDYIIRGKITHIYADVENAAEHKIYADKAKRWKLEVLDADGYLADQSLYLWGYFVYLTDVEVDFNPDTSWYSNRHLAEIIRKRQEKQDVSNKE